MTGKWSEGRSVQNFNKDSSHRPISTSRGATAQGGMARVGRKRDNGEILEEFPHREMITIRTQHVSPYGCKRHIRQAELVPTKLGKCMKDERTAVHPAIAPSENLRPSKSIARYNLEEIHSVAVLKRLEVSARELKGEQVATNKRVP